MLMRKHLYLVGLAFFLLPQSVAANETLDNLRRAAGGLQTNLTPTQVIARIINAILGLVASIFIILIILSGFRWMTSQGSSDQVKKAKETIINSVIGLAVILLSYVITRFIFETLINGGMGPGGGSIQVQQ